MENDFKKLLGESITDDTAAALQEILETHIASLKESLEIAKEDLQEAKEKLEEAQAEHDAEVKSIVEKADEYAEEVRQEVTEELTEKAEAYAEKVREEVTADLTEKADAYGDYLQERAEAYGAYLIEQGEAYGAHLIERAEAYGEHLQEKAEEYGDLRESKALEKAEEMISEFKSEHLEEFERLDEYNRAMTVFKNLKSLVEASGFTIEEGSQLDEMSEELRTLKVEKRRAERQLREQAEEIKSLTITKLVNEMATENMTFTDKERLIDAAMKTRYTNEDEIKSVIKTLVENTSLNKNTYTKKTMINENTEATKTTSGKHSGWASKLV
jgi:F0F1-type ATP synthase membrane subunit b/b'